MAIEFRETTIDDSTDLGELAAETALGDGEIGGNISDAIALRRKLPAALKERWDAAFIELLRAGEPMQVEGAVVYLTKAGLDECRGLLPAIIVERGDELAAAKSAWTDEPCALAVVSGWLAGETHLAPELKDQVEAMLARHAARLVAVAKPKKKKAKEKGADKTAGKAGETPAERAGDKAGEAEAGDKAAAKSASADADSRRGRARAAAAGPFAKFLSAHPAGELRRPTAETIASYRGRLPAPLLDFWAAHGWGPYGGTLLWIIDPDSLRPSLADWLEEPETSTPIVRTAFGHVFVWDEGKIYLLDPHYRRVQEITSDVPRFFDAFLTAPKILEKVLWSDLYRSAAQRLGSLTEAECFGFTKVLAAGGTPEDANIEKVRLREHLTYLATTDEEAA